MMDKPRPKLSLSLSSASLAKLKEKIPKPYVKPVSASTLFKNGKNPVNKAAAKAKKAAPPRRKPHNVLRKDMRTIGRLQFSDMLFVLNKNNKVTFPDRGDGAVALKVGIHKDIARIFKISSPKAYMFLKIYCGSPRYKQAMTRIGEPRYNLKGKKVGVVV